MGFIIFGLIAAILAIVGNNAKKLDDITSSMK